MKKILALLFLISTISIFGYEVSDTMQVTARVIQPITVIVVEDMDFGNIVKGSKNNATGKFTIEGDIGAEVIVDIPQSVVIRDSNWNELTVSLTFDNPDNLDYAGKTEVEVRGDLETLSNTQSGLYTGEFLIKVRYK